MPGKQCCRADIELEKEPETDQVMVALRLCIRGTGRYMPSGWMGIEKLLKGSSLHPSNLGQRWSCGHDIRDGEFDLDDLRFFQRPLRSETDPPLADIFGIPLCFHLRGCLEG